MRLKRIFKNIGVFAITAALTLSVIPSLSIITKADTVDANKTGSISIHKYDITAANKQGVDTSICKNNGETDADAETNLKDYAIPGVVFSYLKVADIYTNDTGVANENSVQMLYGFSDTTLIKDIGLQTDNANLVRDNKYYYTSTKISEALKTKLENNNTETKNKLEDYIKTSNGKEFEETDSNGLTRANNLNVGLYLVVETYVPEDVTYTTDPFLIQIPMTNPSGDSWMYDINVYPKNQTDVPTLNKKVADDDDYSTEGNNGHKLNDTASISEGDTVDYRITSKLPSINSKASYLTKYTFVDTLHSKGLAYNKESVNLYWYKNKKDAEKNNTEKSVSEWKQSDNKFNLKFTESTMTVSITDKGLNEINPNYGGYYVVISYSITVKSTDDLILGDNGNPNDVTLTYSRTNTKYEETLKDEAIVYSYGINLIKKFSDGNGDMSKVKFILSNVTRQTDDKTNKYYVIAKKTEPGIYHVMGETQEKNKATNFTPDQNGKIRIYGLEANTYNLTETGTDDGYSLLNDDIKIKITKTEANIVPSTVTIRGKGLVNNDITYTLKNTASATVNEKTSTMITKNNSANAVVKVSVNNEKKFPIPATGSLGTFVITLLGIITIGAGFVIGKSKKTEEK